MPTTIDKKIKIIHSFFKSKVNINEDLIKSGKLDSLKILDLIIFIEKKTKKKIPPKKINQKSFSNISNIIKLI